MTLRTITPANGSNPASETVDANWTPPTFTLAAITSDDVKAEAEARILAIVPEWRQRNLLAQATILAEKGRSNWTAQELAAWTAGEAIWGQVAAIRTASDLIEAAPPASAQALKTDNRWPT